MSQYDASIIIPTYNRKASLVKALRALEQQTWPKDNFQVLVVDDGSTDDTHRIVDLEFSFPLRYVRQRNQGSASARNFGASLSTGNILIFIDDDIIAEPEYIEGIILDHRNYTKIIAMATCITVSDPAETLFSRIYTESINPQSVDQKGAFVSYTECVTNNLSIRREDFFDLGMMQDVAGDGPTWWGDVDFGYRALKAGFRFKRSGRAVCRHYDYSFSSLPVLSRRLSRVGEVSVHLLEKYPGIIADLPMLLDKTPISLKDDSPALILHKLWHSMTSQRPVLTTMEYLVQWIEHRNPNPALLRPLYRWILSGYIYQGFHLGLRQVKSAPTTA